MNGRFADLNGDPRFFALLEEMAQLHDRKNRDYGQDGDPLANCRASVDFGTPAWVGTMIRANDKMHRIKAFAQKGELANEGVEDSLIDLAAYCLIALILYRELDPTPPPQWVDGGIVKAASLDSWMGNTDEPES